MVRPWPLFLPDLTLWHSRNSDRGTLPPGWQGLPIEEICRRLRVPQWRPFRPWRIELPGIVVRETRGPAEKTLTWETSSGLLTSRWTLGPDGDWWQSEYPVKSRVDCAAAREVAEARRYVARARSSAAAEPGEMSAQMSPGATVQMSPGATVMELPKRPWSELLHSFVGWSEGLMFVLEEPAALHEIVVLLEERLARLVSEMAQLPGDLTLSPDNLDGQFVSPESFQENLAPSYARTVQALHACGKRLVVHVGGPVSGLLPGLARSGIDCVQGVSGPPQGDSTLEAARELSGPNMALWGGIPQDCLLASCTEAEFRRAAEAAFSRGAADPRVIVGVADRVPADALPGRIAALAEMAIKAQDVVDPGPESGTGLA